MTWKDVSRYRTELMGAACLWIMGFHGFLYGLPGFGCF